MESDDSLGLPARTSCRRSTVEEVLAKVEAESLAKDLQTWVPPRRMLWKVVSSPFFDAAAFLTILVNIFMLVLETNHTANTVASVPMWLRAANIFVMILFAVEVSVRLYVFRGKFLVDPLQGLDLLVVVIDVGMFVVVDLLSFTITFPIEMVRCIRVLKVTRMVRMMAMFPELHMLLKGILCATKSILWGCVLFFLALCFFGIIAVLVIHPLNREIASSGYWLEVGCDRCPHAFESVQSSMLTLTQQLVAGDSWGQVTMPILERYPWTGLFFFPVLVFITLAIMNLLLAVIVESAADARAKSVDEQADERERAFKESSNVLYNIFKELDVDGSGYLSFDELRNGYLHHEGFANIMRIMDIAEQDLLVVFELLDTDASGKVHYKEFVQQLHMMRDYESHTLLVFIKFYVMQLRSRLDNVEHSSRHERAKPPLDAKRGSNLPPTVEAPAPAGWEELDQLLEIRNQMVNTLRTQMDSFVDTQARLLDSLAHDVQRQCDGNRRHMLGTDPSPSRGEDGQIKGRTGGRVEVREISGDDNVTTSGLCPNATCCFSDPPLPKQVQSNAIAVPEDKGPSGCADENESPRSLVPVLTI